MPRPAKPSAKRSFPARCTAKWSVRRNSPSTPAKSNLSKKMLCSARDFPGRVSFFSDPHWPPLRIRAAPSPRDASLTSKRRGHTVSRTASLFFSEVPHELRNHASRRRSYERNCELQVRILYHAFDFRSTRLGIAERSATGKAAHPRRRPRYSCPGTAQDGWQSDGTLPSLLQTGIE